MHRDSFFQGLFELGVGGGMLFQTVRVIPRPFVSCVDEMWRGGGIFSQKR